MEHLRAAQKQATSIDPSFKDAIVDINTDRWMFTHGNEDRYPHPYIYFRNRDRDPDFSAGAHLREASYEEQDIPSVWYPRERTSVPVSERRYFLGQRPFPLIPLDAPQGIRLTRYSYCRRLNNAIASISSTRQPAALLPLIRIFEPALDACLTAGRDLPPLPCARLAELPPHPTPPAPALRAAPPMTIVIRGMPARGTFHIGLGDWSYDLVAPGQSKEKNYDESNNQYVMMPAGWFSNFRTHHTLYTGLSDNPRTPKPGRNELYVATRRDFVADGTEQEVRVTIEIDQERRHTVRIQRHLPALAGVALKSDWAPSAQGRPGYLIMNQSDREIRGYPDGAFWGTVETWRDGKWQYHSGNSSPKEDSLDSYFLEKNDWDFVKFSRQKQPSFIPGRYRFLVRYTTTINKQNIANADINLDIYEASSEFEINR